MLGLLALAIVGITGWRWFNLINQVAIPRNRVPYMAAFLIGGAVGVYAIIHGGLVATITGGLAALVGFIFPALRLQSAQQPNIPAVAVGDPMLALSAPDESGSEFNLATLAGKPYLLKFFRGHW